jgi:hypothetical protein
MCNVLPRKGSTYRKVKGIAGGGFELDAGEAFDFDDELPMEKLPANVKDDGRF